MADLQNIPKDTRTSYAQELPINSFEETWQIR